MSEWNAQKLTEKFVANARELSGPQTQIVLYHARYNKEQAMKNFKYFCNRSVPDIEDDTINFIWNTKYESREYIKNFINIANEQGVHRAIQLSATIINTLIHLLQKGFKSKICNNWKKGMQCHHRNLCLWRHESKLGYRRSYFIDGLNLIEGIKNFKSKIGFERLYLTLIEIIMLGHSSDIKIYFPEEILNEVNQATIDPKDFYFNITISLLKSHTEFLIGTRGRNGDDYGVLSCLPRDPHNCFIVSKDQYRDHRYEFEHLKDVWVVIPNFSLDSTLISCGTRKLGKIWDSKSPQGAPSKYFEPHSLQYRSPGYRYRRSPSPGYRYRRSPSPGHKSRRSRSPGHRSRRSRSPESRTHRHLEFRSRRSPSPESRARRKALEYVELRSRRSPSPESRARRKALEYVEFRSHRSRFSDHRTSPSRECTPEYYDRAIHCPFPSLYRLNNKLRIKT